jgi:hypothetical protein
MSSIVRRFFKTEDHPLIHTIQAMFEHRATADAEARKLAASIGADKPWWKGSKLGGFSFTLPPIGHQYYKVASDPDIYMPAANVGIGRKIIEQMEKLSVPIYTDALLTNNLFLKNNFRDGAQKIHVPQISFNQMSLRVEFVICGVPYYRVGCPEALAPNRDPDVIADAPVPEGFIEMTMDEVKAYMESQKVTVQ